MKHVHATVRGRCPHIRPLLRTQLEQSRNVGAAHRRHINLNNLIEMGRGGQKSRGAQWEVADEKKLPDSKNVEVAKDWDSSEWLRVDEGNG